MSCSSRWIAAPRASGSFLLILTAASRMVEYGREFHPRQECSDVYNRLIEVYRRIYPRMKRLYGQIQRITGYPEL